MKKIIIMFFAFTLILAMNSATFAGISLRKSSGLDDLDTMIISSSYLNSSNTKEDFLQSNSKVKKIVPLYNPSGAKVAFYVSYSPTGYAVVNNNINNPTVIEFGDKSNELIEKILQSNSNPCIIYNNPLDVHELSFSKTTRSSTNQISLYDYYPELKTTNSLAKQQLENQKLAILHKTESLRSKGYGFIDWGNMPSGNYTYGVIKSATSTNWAKVGDFSSFAKNHCGATAVTNIALYYAERGCHNLKINNSNMDTFKAVHALIGNGPAITIKTGANVYFSDRGYTLGSKTLRSFSEVKSAVDRDRICAILLQNGIVDWHWILGVGYREYDNGTPYIRIVNNWHDTTYKFYRPNSGSLWWSAREYWPK
jgi:hypothetical protein